MGSLSMVKPLNIVEYDEIAYNYAKSFVEHCNPIIAGFFRWYDELWSSPWPGGFVLAMIENKKTKPCKFYQKKGLRSEAEFRKDLLKSARQAYNRYDFHKKYHSLEKIQESYLEALLVDPHIEKPVRLYLGGYDDYSFSRVYETDQEALDVLEDLVTCATMPNLKRLGLIFTN